MTREPPTLKNFEMFSRPLIAIIVRTSVRTTPRMPSVCAEVSPRMDHAPVVSPPLMSADR